MEPTAPSPSSPAQQAHLAFFRLMARHGTDPIPEDALRQALAELRSAPVDALLDSLLRNDVARRVPEGWVMRGHGPKTASIRWRLLRH
ncbi:MAG TPA: hypothetical protein VM582_00590 [Candidatus Thermoplasmatota archaeon]|nr:hypothetical protein [Candidatus Thermoplasmatota archaeon]